MTYILLFFILIFLTFLAILIHNKTKSHLSEDCNSDNDCPKDYSCQENPEINNKKQCLPSNKIFCKITPSTELMKCSITDPNSCSVCLNNPQYSCVEVNKDNPYIWKQNGVNMNIPDSSTGFGWCLPDIVNRDIECNKFTADYILQEIKPGVYQWGCSCKYPNLFDHVGEAGSDCLVRRACREVDGFGKLYVPIQNSKICKIDSDCGSNNKCLNPLNPIPCGYTNDGGIEPSNDCSTSGSCVCHTSWEGPIVSEIDPLAGQCVCRNNYDFQCIKRSSDNFELNCIKGQCTCDGCSEAPSNTCNSSLPQHTCCNCPKGMIRCPDDIPSNNTGLINYCLRTGSTCIADPCKTTSVPDGYYDSNIGSCICPGGGTPIEDENSPVGLVCKNLCEGNGPCGNRGTCYTVGNQARCKDCVCPFINEGDTTCTCSIMKEGNIYGQQGSLCCNDKDCCSGNCSGNCDNTGDSGICIGPSPVISTGDCTPIPPITPTECKPGFSCPAGSSCIESKKGNNDFSCCPYPSGVSCYNGTPTSNPNCCPSDYPICNTTLKQCISTDGKSSIPFK